MSEKKELSKEELEKTLGGYFSSEAKSWYDRNFNEIYMKSGRKPRSL